MNTDYLIHYGVLGMKWGIHRSNRKSAARYRLSKKAAKYQKKSDKLEYKASKASRKNKTAPHYSEEYSKYDAKSKKYKFKSSKAALKATKTEGLRSRRYALKSDKYAYKSALNEAYAKEYGGMYPVGTRSFNLSMKSSEYKLKALRTKQKISRNNLYIRKIQEKIADVDDSKKILGKKVYNSLMSIDTNRSNYLEE